MHFGDKCAMCGLQNGIKLVEEAEREIDCEAANMLEKVYVDDCVGGGDDATLDRLIGKESWIDKQQGFALLLLYPELKHAKRHQNLKVGDVCLVYYDNKVKETYRLCIVFETIASTDGIVRTVRIGFRPRRACGPGTYRSVPLDEMEVATQRLRLLVPKEEANEDVKAGEVAGVNGTET